MSDIGRAFGALVVAAGLGAGAVFAGPFLSGSDEYSGSDQSRDETVSTAEPPADTPLSAYRAREAGASNDASFINQMCGLTEIWSGGQAHLELIGEAPGQFSILRAPAGDMSLFERYASSADNLHAFPYYNEVYI